MTPQHWPLCAPSRRGRFWRPRRRCDRPACATPAICGCRSAWTDGCCRCRRANCSPPAARILRHSSSATTPASSPCQAAMSSSMHSWPTHSACTQRRRATSTATGREGQCPLPTPPMEASRSACPATSFSGARQRAPPSCGLRRATRFGSTNSAASTARAHWATPPSWHSCSTLCRWPAQGGPRAQPAGLLGPIRAARRSEWAATAAMAALRSEHAPLHGFLRLRPAGQE